MVFKIQATSGLKFNLWRGEVRHLATRNLFEFQPTPTFCHVSISFPHHGSTSRLVRRRTGKDGKTQMTWAHTGHPAAAGTDLSLRAHTQATHSPPRLETRKPHHRVTAGIVPNCRHPTDLALTTSTRPTRTPLPRHRHHHHAAISTPSPNCPDAHAIATSTATTTATNHHVCQQRNTSTIRKYRNPPLSPQLPPPPLLPTTTHASTSTAASTRPPQPSTDPVLLHAPRHCNNTTPAPHRPRPAQPTPSCRTRHATATTPPPPHPTDPVPPNRPGPTSFL
ncbi:hypothetical protein EDB89DRAFT_1912730 [Lactarius sanguifluus]|nr:hypothetical protein EDB89DRAFT_1912728 [Lactarius sanguifluus]KAH9163355.1 hypothetical protein EDB89DRAFT_1912730 [Lactarius sanguifluus]